MTSHIHPTSVLLHQSSSVHRHRHADLTTVNVGVSEDSTLCHVAPVTLHCDEYGGTESSASIGEGASYQTSLILDISLLTKSCCGPEGRFAARPRSHTILAHVQSGQAQIRTRRVGCSGTVMRPQTFISTSACTSRSVSPVVPLTAVLLLRR